MQIKSPLTKMYAPTTLRGQIDKQMSGHEGPEKSIGMTSNQFLNMLGASSTRLKLAETAFLRLVPFKSHLMRRHEDDGTDSFIHSAPISCCIIIFFKIE